MLLKLVQSGRLQPQKLVTHHFRLGDVMHATPRAPYLCARVLLDLSMASDILASLPPLREVATTRALAAETAGRIGVTLLVPGGMRTSFFDGRDEQYRPAEDAPLNDPGDVADAVAFALTRPPGCEVRELLIAPDRETSWP